jgi:hypothetical protein
MAAAVVPIASGAQKKPPLPHWLPDKELVKSLAPTVKIAGYILQPPKGYKMRMGSPPQGVAAMAWAGEKRDDGTRPTLIFSLIDMDARDLQQYTIEDLADKLLGGVKRRRTEWQQGKTERGIVNGMTFARISWTGTESEQKHKMRGFIYVALDGDSIIQLTSQDVLPVANQSVPLAEAAVLTFKKQ